MKKFYILLAAAAALTLSANAQALEGSQLVGNFDSPSDIYNGSYFDVAPTNFYIAHTGAQMLFTPEVLSDMQDKANIQINKISFKFINYSAYDDITRTFNLYLQEVDETAFNVNDKNNKEFFAVGAPVATKSETFEMLDLLYEDTEIEFDIVAAPFNLTPGKTLVVTVTADADDDDNCTSGSDDAPFYTSGIGGKAMVYTNNWNSFEQFAQTEGFPEATATVGCGTNVELPVTKIDFTYEEATGVEDIKVADNSAAVRYNILGQPVDANYRGIVIENGKKLIVK